MPGISLHHELAALVSIGHTPREALATATSNFGATFANWGPVGEIQPGYRADILVLDRDPRIDVANLETLSTVVLAGKVRDPKALLGQRSPANRDAD
jgi:imidazolonepropionase-like amidohydrolase